MKNKFYVGQKVVCIVPGIDPELGLWYDLSRWLVKDEIYEIRWIGIESFQNVNCDWEIHLGVKLKGIYRRTDYPMFDNDFPFGAIRFRPLITIDDFMKKVNTKELENV